MRLLLKGEAYPPAVLASLLIHGALFYFMLEGGFMTADYMEVEQPVYLSAVTIQANPQRLRRLERIEEQRLAERREREEREREEARRLREREAQQEAERQRLEAEEQERRRAEEEAAQAERQRQLEEEQRARDELARQEQEQLARQQAEEAELARQAAAQRQAELQAVENQLVAEYSALIRWEITRNWKIPPNARNGMTALLRLQLVPTGEVVGVMTLRSSGDEVFDRSALQAVERVERFPELQELENPVFERNFRSFDVLFRPEDLLR